MKILYTATVLSHICQFHLPHMQRLQREGYEVHVAAHDNLSLKNGLKLMYCDRFFEVPFSRSPKSLDNIKAYFILKHLLAETHYDVIICNTPVGGIVTRLAAKQAHSHGTKVIYMAHGFHFFKGSSKLSWKLIYPLEKYMAKYCDVLITVNNEDYDLAKSSFHSCKVAHIHGVGVDADRYHPVSIDEQHRMREQETLANDAFVVLCTGELLPNKNQKTLRQAFSILKREWDSFSAEQRSNNPYSNIILLLAGNGPEKANLEVQIKALGLEDHVRLLGYRSDLEKLVPAVDLVVSCSYREGLGLNVIEAMLCAKPVVASHNRGHDELVAHNETGYLFPSDDAEALAGYLLHLMQNKNFAERAGKRGLEVVQPYKAQTVVNELLPIITGRQ